MSLQEILELTPKDRLQIAEKIWESLEPDDIQITKEQEVEMRERIAVDKAGRMLWYTLDDVKKRLDQKNEL